MTLNRLVAAWIVACADQCRDARLHRDLVDLRTWWMLWKDAS